MKAPAKLARRQAAPPSPRRAAKAGVKPPRGRGGAYRGDGTSDVPGVAPLARFSPLLHVGNQYAAAHGAFDVVISTVCPRAANGDMCRGLTTHALHFDDGHGEEAEEEAAFASKLIVQGAGLVAKAIRAGRRTLVHCEWGQNRSGAICCAYAVLYLGWSSTRAIAHMRAQNRKHRKYAGQFPMSNGCFNRIVKKLEASRKAMRARG